MNSSNTKTALDIALRHNPYLLRKIGLVCHDLHSTLLEVSPVAKDIAATVYNAKMEREADTRAWQKIKIITDGKSGDTLKAWAYYVPNGPQDLIMDSDLPRFADYQVMKDNLWVSKKTIKRFIKYLVKEDFEGRPCMGTAEGEWHEGEFYENDEGLSAEIPRLYDFEFLKQRRTGLTFDRTLCRLMRKTVEVDWYQGWE